MPDNNVMDSQGAAPVIFLDFDGVLKENGEWRAEAIEQINLLCREAGARVVFTTSERYSHSPRALHQMLRKLGLNASIVVLGETRDLGAYRRAARRNDWAFMATFPRIGKGEEIGQWLAAHPDVQRYIILDDQIDTCAPYEKRTVVPKVAVLGEADRLRALALLRVI